MLRKLFLLIPLLLASCISISVETETPAPQAFVTSTLPVTGAAISSTLAPLPTFTPLIAVTSTIMVTAPANCKDNAVLLEDVTIPDNTSVRPGEKFTKTWRFQNTGTCPWTNYKLAFAAGDRMNAPDDAPISAADPSAKVNISVDLVAPSTNGIYTGYFTLNNPTGKNVPIGAEKTFWVKIIVGNANAIPTAGAIPTSASHVTPNAGNCNYSENAGYVNQLVGLINSARSAAHLPQLAVNAQLTSAAQSHSLDMACNNFNSHTGSDGSDIGARIIAAGYRPSHYVEILAFGTPADAMSQWSNLPDHWEAVLNKNMTEIGVGYVYSANSDFGGYWTVDMGSP
jgi:uncharacterized protein YkwD